MDETNETNETEPKLGFTLAKAAVGLVAGLVASALAERAFVKVLSGNKDETTETTED